MHKTYVDRLAEAGADTTKFRKTLAVLVVIIAVLMSVFHLYRAQVGVLEAWRQRSLHVLFTLALAYMVSVARAYEKKRNPVLGWLGVILTLAIAVYTHVDYYGIIGREGAPNLYDKIAGTLLMVLLVWATKEHVSSVISYLVGIFFLYGMYGWMLPGDLPVPGSLMGKSSIRCSTRRAACLGCPQVCRL